MVLVGLVVGFVGTLTVIGALQILEEGDNATITPEVAPEESKFQMHAAI